MVWLIDTNSLMKLYSKRDYKDIEKTNFIVISSRVRITKDRKNVLQAANLFINSGMLKGVGYELEPDSLLAKEKFKSFLLKSPDSLNLICRIIESFLLEGEDAVLLCSPNEMDCHYMQTLAEVVMDMFHFPIPKYPEEKEFNAEEVIKRLLYYKEKVQELRIRKAKPLDRVSLLKKLSNKELKKALKKRSLYQKNMGRGEMIELLVDYF